MKGVLVPGRMPWWMGALMGWMGVLLRWVLW